MISWAASSCCKGDALGLNLELECGNKGVELTSG